MFKKSKLGLIAALVLGALWASVPSAGALTVTVSPGGGVTGTATTGVVFAFNTVGRSITCSSSTFTATLAGGSTTLSTDFYPGYGPPCTLTGGVPITGPCAFSSLHATGATTGGVTPISLTGFSCTPLASASCHVQITGSITGRYDNSSGQLSFALTGQSLTATGSTCAALPNDSNVRMSSVIPGGAVVYNVSPRQTITAV